VKSTYTIHYYVKVHQKLDLMGIGANRRGPEGDDAGWRGAREFEGLLARLNQAQNADTQEIPVDDEDAAYANGSVADQPTMGVVANESSGINDHSLDTSINGTRGDAEQKKKKKRKRNTIEDEETDPKEAKRRRKEEKKEQRKVEKAEKSMKKSHDSEQVALTSNKPAQDTGGIKTMSRVRA
jgi:hypothetical protein